MYRKNFFRPLTQVHFEISGVRKLILFAILFVTSAIAFGSSYAKAGTHPVINEIRERYQICRALRSQKLGLVYMYGVYTDLQNQERPKWYFSTPENGMVLSRIYLYSPPGQQTGFAELSESTPSGDWYKVSEYCFRTDGSLAFIFSDYRTTYGNVRIEDRLYFDKRGRQVRNIRRIFDLNTGKRLPDSTSNFADRQAQIYRNVSELARELKTGKPANQASAPTTTTTTTTSEPVKTQIPPSPTSQTPPASTSFDTVQQEDIRKLVSKIVPEIESVVGPSIAPDLTAIRSETFSVSDYNFLANAAYINNKAEIAAWAFAQGILKGKLAPQGLNNFAVALEDSYMVDAAKRPKQWINASRTLLKLAASKAPDDALILNNLAWNAFRLSQQTGDATLLGEAIETLKKAIAIEPDRPLFQAHLAELYLASGKNKLAAAALNRAHKLNSADPAFLSVVNRPGGAIQSVWSQSPRNYCEVNYACLKTCPGGIIGRIMVVSCEIEQSNARQACGAGKPYAKTYRCEEEIPEYGILIPGLNSGFSIVTPFGRVDMTINGAGKVNYRVKGGPKLPGNLGAEIEVRGTYTPEGGVKVQRITPKISINIPTGTAVGEQLNNLNMGPMTLSVSGNSGGTVNIESFDSTLRAIKSFNPTLWGH
jgi:tetratricopeptide (TPR) repeat protein